jgi:hypothetical protein
VGNVRYRRSAKGRAAKRRYAAKYPQKDRARKALSAAVRRGVLDRPDSCSRCGGPGRPEGHHDDYTRPLDVAWLCKPCHVAEHRDTE